MKKIFTTLLALTLGLILSLSVFACDGEQPDQTSESVKPEPVVAVDGVNVQNIIEALGPMSESEYLTVNVEFGKESGEIAYGDVEGDTCSVYYSSERLLSAEIKIKKTNSGYDFIARIVDESKDTHVLIVYYVDGSLVYAYEVAGRIIMAEIEEEKKTFNSVISELNAEIAEDEEMRKTYEQILVMSEKVKALFDQGTMASLDETFDIDLRRTVNDAFTYLKTNSQKTLYELVITEMGITQTEEEVEQIVFSVVKEFCADNPTLTEFIDRVVDAINQDLEPESQIDLREICNAIEAQGLSATLFCGIVNYLAGDEVLTAPQTTVSLYDYLTSLIAGFKVDDLAQLMLGMEGATVSDLATYILQSAKQTTLGDVVFNLLNIDLSTFAITFEDLYANANLQTDSKSRITSFSAEYNVCYTTLDEMEGTSSQYSMARLTTEISYEKFDTKIAIPQEVLDILEETKQTSMA